MGHGQEHHHHRHHLPEPVGLPPVLDTSVPDEELSPAEVSRRTMLRGAGLLGTGAAAENSFDGVVNNATAATPADEALAIAGVKSHGGHATQSE
jgi:hypothetical protein